MFTAPSAASILVESVHVYDTRLSLNMLLYLSIYQPVPYQLWDLLVLYGAASLAVS